MNDRTPASLIAEILQLDGWIDQQRAKFDEFLKPHREQIEALKNKLQEFLLANAKQEGGHPKASFSCNEGTAYLSTTTSYSIDGDKTVFLDWILENWDDRGDMLAIGSPYVNPVRAYMDSNEGHLPPHLKSSSITRCNVKHS